jgi:hypothetical protein
VAYAAPVGGHQASDAGHDESSPDGRSVVFLFFSNRLGCLGSLLVSAVLTLLVIGVLVLLSH